jgi:hypothetical protein
MLYELATPTIHLGMAAKGVGGIDTYVKAPEAKGNLLGCWATEIGDLNQLIVLRGFADASELGAERWRTLSTTNPFNCGEVITRLSLVSYAPFPFLPPVTPGKFGSVYEIRTYALKLGGVPLTIAAWQAALRSARNFSAHHRDVRHRGSHISGRSQALMPGRSPAPKPSPRASGHQRAVQSGSKGRCARRSGSQQKSRR